MLINNLLNKIDIATIVQRIDDLLLGMQPGDTISMKDAQESFRKFSLGLWKEQMQSTMKDMVQKNETQMAKDALKNSAAL